MRIATLLAVAALAASGCASDSTTSEPQSTTPTPDAVTTVDSTTAPTDELTSEIEFEWPLAGCSEGNLASSRLHRIDAAAGVVEWSVDTPWAPDGPVVLDHGTVVLVEKAYDRPSVVAYDLVTGEGQWQRRFDGLQAELVATDNRGVVVIIARERLFDRRAVVVGADGAVDDSPVAIGGVAHNDQGPAWWQSRYVIGPEGAAWDPFANPPAALLATGFSSYQAIVIGDAAVTVDGSRVGFVDLRVVWESTVPVDAEFSELVDVRVGEESVLLLFGSELGPNRRLVVLDRLDGSPRWTLDGIRDADAAGHRVIYDRRTDVPTGDGATREVFLVDQVDPSEVVWSALAHEPLGGFLGTFDGMNHFVHRDPAIWPRAPYPEVGAITEVQIFEPELLIVGDDGPEDMPMSGGDRDLRRTAGRQTASGDGWSAAIIGGLVWFTRDGDTQTIDLGPSPRHLLAAGNALLATTGTPEVFCD